MIACHNSWYAIIFFSCSLIHFHFFSGHINTFSSAYSKSFHSIVLLFSFAILREASLHIFSISAHTKPLVLFDNESTFTSLAIFFFLR